MSAARWVVHLPTGLDDRAAVVTLLHTLRDSWGHLPALDFGEATISPEDDQSRRTRVWCDARTDGGRCRLDQGHAGACRSDRCRRVAPPGHRPLASGNSQ